MSDPIVVSATCSPSKGDRRQVILKHPSRGAMMVHEVRFFFKHKGTGPIDGQGNAVDAFRVKVKAGNWDLTDGDVPVALLCPLTDNALYFLTDTAANYGIVSLTWKLPKPLYLPRNGQMTFDFTVALDLIDPAAMPSVGTTYNNTTVGVAIVGEALAGNAPPPNKVYAPFATAWLSPTSLVDPALGNDGGVINAVSGVHDLKNPRNYALNVSHLTVCATYGQSAVPGGPTNYFIDALGDVAGIPQIAPSALGVASVLPQPGIRVQIRDTRGGFIVRDPTPLGLVFNMTERAWRMNTVLAPRQYFIVTLSGAWGVQPASLGGSIGLRTSIGLLGHHEIAVADLGVSL